MSVDSTPITAGDTFEMADGTTVYINRVAKDAAWADVKVTQPHGASWSKRQPLMDGCLPYPADLVAGVSV